MDAILPARSNSNTTKITVAAGGIGVWIVMVLFAFMAGLNWSLNTKLITQDIQLSDQDRRIERMQDHLNAIYMMAPQLKPAEESK